MKEIKYIFYTLLCTMLLNGCKKEIGVDEPKDLTITVAPLFVKADTLRYHVGDTAKFLMSGNADQILFYSGEIGSEYAYANRVSVAGIPQLSFTSNAQTGTQLNTLQVLYINKLDKLDATNILAANWNDITSLATLSVGSGAVASRVINLPAITGAQDSLFIAFKYKGNMGTAQRTWTITNLTVNNLLADGKIVPHLTLAADLNFWTRVNTTGSTSNWVPTATQLQVIGGGATAPNNESWIVSKPIYIGRVSPDVPKVVKRVASEIPVYTIGGKITRGYNYQYKVKGTFKATFVVSNNAINEQKTVLKQFVIKVI